jgi:glycosyltransferase involved in cell wall biosynthesis
MKSALDITIVIPVKNEEVNLRGCLNAIGKNWVKNIVLIDSGSTDGTLAIAESFGIKVINFAWDGRFPKKRNWYLQQHQPATKWVLFLDADEYITEAFKEELEAALTDDGCVGYWLSYTIYFMGKKLKGGYPLRKLALFKVGAGEYERIDEEQWSRLDMEIHEHPVLNGKTGTIKSKIDHRDFRGISHYVLKHNEYAAWEAGRYLKAISNDSLRKTWTWKQKIKYRLMRSVWIGPLFFLGSFFLMGGFKDGARGFAFAILKMSYFTQIYCKIKELGIKGLEV